MCMVCGCGDKVMVGDTEMSHDEAHRLGLAHHHPGPTAHSHSHSHGGLTHNHSHDPTHGHAEGTENRHGAGDHPDAQEALHFGLGAAGVSVPGLGQARLIEVETAILSKNDAIATSNRRVLNALGVLALNLVSSPGSGKTLLLCRTIEALGDAPLAVIEGDQQTSNDAERIRATGAQALQVNTGKGCHLDAQMVGMAIDRLRPRPRSYLFIENVGNLVCPAAFDLGEDAKVAILSVTEGEDKPLKYPDMFTAARLALLTKIDLARHCDADLDAYEANLRRVNPQIEILRLSARTGEGMAAWLDWLRNRLAAKA
jgi:hydrogenase nickel incorporation protein HypB